MAEFAPTVPRITDEMFLVVAYDGEGSTAVRDDKLGEHLEYIEKRYENYVICGPLREPGETELIGSFFLVRAANEKAASELVLNDPYVISGMYAQVRVLSATAAAGTMIGGVIWESAEAIRAATTS